MNLIDFYCEWLMDVDARERLAEIIKRARGKLSQRQFAKRLGVSQPTVRSWEECESMPGTGNLEAIASLTGQSLPELLHYLRGEDSRESVEKQCRASKVEDLIVRVNALSKNDLARLIQVAASRLVEMGGESE